MPHPNRAQWIILWCSAIAIAVICVPEFFAALPRFDLFYGAFIQEIDRHKLRAGIVVVTWGVLLLWQFSRQVRWRSPILVPVGFVLACELVYIGGAVRYKAAMRSTESQVQTRVPLSDLTDAPPLPPCPTPEELRKMAAQYGLAVSDTPSAAAKATESFCAASSDSPLK